MGGGLLVAILSFTLLPLHIVLLVVLSPVVLFSAILYLYFLYRNIQRRDQEEVPHL